MKIDFENVKRNYFGTNEKLSALANKYKQMEVQNAKKQRLEFQNISKKKSRSEENDGKCSAYKIESVVSECATNICDLTKFTMLNDNFHKSNPTHASTMFGFLSWSETKHCIELFFRLALPVHAM